MEEVKTSTRALLVSAIILLIILVTFYCIEEFITLLPSTQSSCLYKILDFPVLCIFYCVTLRTRRHTTGRDVTLQDAT